MEHEIILQVTTEVTKFIPAFSEDRPDWGQEHFPADVEFIVLLEGKDITTLLPIEELEYLKERILDNYN